jgi:DNA polymerase III sliding clamp (beta) subunit (PCNA family)
MSEVTFKINPDLDRFKDVILFPSKHQSAVETLISVPFPDAAPLTPIQKVTILLAEIEQTNKSIKYFDNINDEIKLQECYAMKECFVLLVQNLMEEQFEVLLYRKAA